jgi:hypothetical protein
MSKKHLVCQGAICQCQFGTTPDTLKVLTQSKQFINDKEGKEKLMATHRDIGMTFEKNTFGSCKMMKNNPCVPALIQWQGYYENIQIEENQGKALLEDSKGICSVAGSPCISITFHGQIAEVSPQNVQNVDNEDILMICPVMDLSELEKHKIQFKVT